MVRGNRGDQFFRSIIEARCNAVGFELLCHLIEGRSDSLLHGNG